MKKTHNLRRLSWPVALFLVLAGAAIVLAGCATADGTSSSDSPPPYSGHHH